MQLDTCERQWNYQRRAFLLRSKPAKLHIIARYALERIPNLAKRLLCLGAVSKQAPHHGVRLHVFAPYGVDLL